MSGLSGEPAAEDSRHPPREAHAGAFEPWSPEIEEIPTIGDDMLHPDLEFELGMSAVPLVSLILMSACLVGFVASAARGALHNLNTLVAVGALSRPEVQNGEVWRLVSAMFLHGGIDHLIGNLIVLYILGMACEHAFGRLQFLTLFVTAGLVGAAFSLTSRTPSIGASGAIFGLIGAMVTTLWKHRTRLHLRDRRIGVVLLIWAGYQILLGALSPEIDNRAHLGGFLGGALLGLILPSAVLHGRKELAERPAVRAAFAAACIALAATSIAFLPRLFR